MREFLMELDILLCKKAEFQTFMIIKKQNVVILKSVFNENHNHCYYKVFLEKCSYKLCKNVIL